MSNFLISHETSTNSCAIYFPDFFSRLALSLDLNALFHIQKRNIETFTIDYMSRGHVRPRTKERKKEEKRKEERKKATRIAAGIFTDHLADGIFDTGIPSIFDNGSRKLCNPVNRRRTELVIQNEKKKKRDQNFV